MKSPLTLVAVISLGAGCDVGGGSLTGAGGDTLATGMGGAGVMTGSGGIVTGSGGGIATGSGGDGRPNACGVLFPVAPVQPEIVLMLDTSATMNDGFDGPCPGGCGSESKWAAVVSTVQSVVAAETSVNWGLQLLTNGGADVCASPAVTVPVGSTNATGILSELSRRSAGGTLVDPGNRPTRAAINSAAAHLYTRMSGARQAILLITDGVPDCAGTSNPLASDLAGAVRAISYASGEGIPTLIAGMAIAPEAETSLSEMAFSGGLARAGSPRYFPVSGSADLGAAVSELIAAGACVYAIPEPPNPMVSRGHIGVFIDGNAVPREPGHLNGWDHVSPSMDSFQLYGAACDASRSGQSVSITWYCLAV